MGTPTIAPTAAVATNAVIWGDVVLGPESCVLFNATIRGDHGGRARIGARSNVQELACLHADKRDILIGDDVSIGHGAIVHGATVGDRTVVGMGAILLDGARVGHDCLIGAGALVTGKADIPDGMLVMGSPAKTVRPLTPEEIAGLAENAAEYVETARELVAAGLLVAG